MEYPSLTPASIAATSFRLASVHPAWSGLGDGGAANGLGPPPVEQAASMNASKEATAMIRFICPSVPSRCYVLAEVPGEGLEPSHPFGQRILSPPDHVQAVRPNVNVLVSPHACRRTGLSSTRIAARLVQMECQRVPKLIPMNDKKSCPRDGSKTCRRDLRPRRRNASGAESVDMNLLIIIFDVRFAPR